jgi:hypothetical protein
MRFMKLAGILAAVVVIVSAFFPWVIIESKDLVVSGVDNAGLNYGKRGYWHFIFCGAFILLSLFKSVEARRVNVFVAAINLAWSLANFLVYKCEGGECPVKQPALYISILGSVAMMAAVLFAPDPFPKAENQAGRGF